MKKDINQEVKEKKISLWGYMGAGKSTLGKMLAKELGYSFVDLDEEIEKEEGSISQIFKEKGEIGFRKLEKSYLHRIRELKKPLVLSTGGGTPIFYTNAEDLNQMSQSVYLRAKPLTLAKRLFPERQERPLIQHLTTIEDLTEFVAKHLFERSSFYAKADFQYGIDDQNLEEVLSGILKKVK